MVRRSFGNAFGLSAVTHAAIFLLILFITARMPDPASSQRAAPGAMDSIIWMPRPGQGGGGGDSTPEPPRRAEAPGRERATVAARARPVPDPQPAAVAPPRPVALIDAILTASGLTEIPGVIAPTPSAPASLGPGAGGGAGAGRGGGSGPGGGTGLGDGQDRGYGGGPFQPGTNGVSYPRLIREVAPLYTNGAMQARVEGIVFLSAIVRVDGSVGDAWITRSLDRTFGLDQEALRVVKLWRFAPAAQAGRPVDAVVPIEIQFTIR
jgi:periplasmic protein TonB